MAIESTRTFFQDVMKQVKEVDVVKVFLFFYV